MVTRKMTENSLVVPTEDEVWLFKHEFSILSKSEFYLKLNSKQKF
jgi:hypothetical protein